MQKNKIAEIFRFLVAGVAGFIVELLSLVLLKEKLGLDTLIATPIAFVFSVAVNYLMCVLWVFDGARKQTRRNKAGFFITSAIGLLLNELLMFLFRIIWGEDQIILTIFSFAISLYIVNKVISTCIVMIWNYFTKRLILTR